MKQRAIKAADYLRRGVSEHRLQVSVLELLETHAVRNVYWFSIPNEAKRTPMLASRMKARGLRAGVADLCVMLSGGKVAWLELKTLKGSQSEAQKNFAEICLVLGHPYAVAHDLDEALAALRRWGAIT